MSPLEKKFARSVIDACKHQGFYIAHRSGDAIFIKEETAQALARKFLGKWIRKCDYKVAIEAKCWNLAEYFYEIGGDPISLAKLYLELRS